MDTNMIGDYQIIKELGKSALGKVFLVEHGFLKRRFLMKMLPSSLTSKEGFAEKFQAAIANLSAINHPSLVNVHDASCIDGKYFIITDIALSRSSGIYTLRDYLMQHPKMLHEKDMIQILFSIAKGLDFLHSQDVLGVSFVHGAINLDNIYIANNNPSQALLSDFGLVELLGSAFFLLETIKESAVAMQSTSFLHTLDQYNFLSPEQKYHRDLKSYSDVYAFGVLTYYLIMRRYPEGFFALPSQIALDFRGNWDEVIFQCLQLDPAKRPRNLYDLLIEHTSEVVKKESSNLSSWQAMQSQNLSHQVPLEAIEHMDITKKTPTYPQKTAAISSQHQTQIANDPYQQITDTLAPKPVAASAIQAEKSSAPAQALQPVIKPQTVEKPIFEPDPGAIFKTETVVAPYKPEETKEKEVEPLLTDMIVLEGGEFYRGSDEGARDERPLHKIHLDSFAIDAHPVSNEQFIRFLQMMGGEKDHNNNDIIRLRESRIRKHGGEYIIESGYSKHPIVGVTWYGAVAYAKWVGKRLPSEAEWEVASRGMKKDVVYPTGQDISRDQANYFSSDTSEVCSFSPTEVGLYDFAGNVYEWCEDWYDYNYYQTSHQEPENPKGPYQGVYRVLRGGCWKSLKDDLRCAHRHRNNPGTGNRTYGFRCASNVC